MFDQEKELFKLTKCTLEIVNEVTTIIRGLTHDHRELLHEQYGFHDENYRNNPRFQSGLWDGKYRFVSKGGITYTMLLEEVYSSILKLGYEIVLDDKRTGFVPEFYEVNEDFFSDCCDKYGNPFQLRPYQCKVANLLLKNMNGIVVAATSAGKGSIICSMAKSMISNNNKGKVIIIVPNTTLVSQSFNECKQFNLDVGEFSGTTKDLDHRVVVSTWQTLNNQPEVLQLFNAVIVDECHSAKANCLKTLLSEYAPHIAMRFGVTGTMPKNKAKNYMVKSCLGPVRYTITAKWLQEQGYISTIDIKHLVMMESIAFDSFPDYDSEVAYLSRPYRIAKIAEFINLYCEQNPSKNILCLVNHKKVGHMMEQMIDAHFYVDGDVKPPKKRVEIFNRFAKEDGIKGVATFGVAFIGLSQDRIHTMFIIDVGKSFIKVIQSVGRGLRKGGGKNHIDVYDVSSSLMWAQKHRKDRNTFYNEAEYPHSVLKVNVD